MAKITHEEQAGIERLAEEMSDRADVLKIVPSYLAAADAGGVEALYAVEPGLYRGLSKSQRKAALKARLESLTNSMRVALGDQFEGVGSIARIEAKKNGAERLNLDTVLRQGYARLRNMKIDLGRWYQFKRVRKFKAMLTEDIPNRFKQAKRTLFDGLGTAAKVAGVGALAAASVGGVVYYNGGWEALKSVTSDPLAAVKELLPGGEKTKAA